MVDSGAGGRNNALAVRVLLSWWRSDCGRNHRKTQMVHWAVAAPKSQEVAFECLGVLNGRAGVFTVEGVLPQALLPVLAPDEELFLIQVLCQSLADQTGWVVIGLRREVVDWIGVDAIV